MKSLDNSPGGLDQVTVNAVKQFEYKPAEKAGIPVSVWVEFEVNYTLE